jgi:hypothetical protein
MLENEFYKWLLKRFKNDKGKTASSRKSNCLRIEEFEGNLDKHYEDDNCHSIIEKLSYSTDDEKHKRPTKHRIPIDGNKRTGTATFKQAIKLYIKFKNETKNGSSLPFQSNKPIHKKNAIIKSINKQLNWPKWELPTEDEIFKLAQITTKYIRFLNPIIIEKITENNIENYEEWRNFLTSKNINPELYLWELSPCCFPGIRRYAGSKEIAYFRKQTEMEKHEIPNALKLDDNDFPKQIWSFIFRGKQFGKSGPDNYSLAHLFDHKESKNRMEEELEFTNNENINTAYFGLYTCPSNTVYIPTSLLKPTDFNLTLRRLLFQKAESLYKNCCNMLPQFIKIPKAENDKWDINNFEWGNCVGTLDNINLFITYRKNIMNKLMGE